MRCGGGKRLAGCRHIQKRFSVRCRGKVQCNAMQRAAASDESMKKGAAWIAVPVSGRARVASGGSPSISVARPGRRYGPRRCSRRTATAEIRLSSIRCVGRPLGCCWLARPHPASGACTPQREIDDDEVERSAGASSSRHGVYAPQDHAREASCCCCWPAAGVWWALGDGSARRPEPAWRNPARRALIGAEPRACVCADAAHLIRRAQALGGESTR